MCGTIRNVVLLSGLAGVLLGTGCSSDSGGRSAESQKTAVSLKDTRQELVKAKTEVNDATAALDRLSAQGGNLEQSFKQYTVAVKDVQASGDRARARAQAMRENARQYVAKWEKEMNQVTSPELRAGAAERRQRVKDSFDGIVSTGRSVRDAYQPFLKDLQDIHLALANDLTPGGVGAAKAAIDDAKAEGKTLNERIDALIAKLDEVSSGMSTSNASAAGSKQASGGGK